MADLIGREHQTTAQLIYKLFWHATFDIPDEQTCPLLFHIKKRTQSGGYLQTHKTKVGNGVTVHWCVILYSSIVEVRRSDGPTI